MIKFKDINYPRRKDIDDNDYSIKCKSKIIKIYNGTETIYNSVSEAAIKNNISVSAIYNCLYGKSKTC